MALHSVGVVEDGGHQVPVLDVHVLEPVALLLTVQLVEHGLLQVDPLDIQNHDETLVVALVAQHVEQVPPRVVHVHLLMDDIRGRAQVRHQIQHDVLETEIARGSGLGIS